MDARTGFVFYDSYFMILRALDGDGCKNLLEKICMYALHGEEPKDFDNPLMEGVWACILPSLKRGLINAENRRKKPESQGKQVEKAGKTEQKTPEKAEQPAQKPTENASTTGFTTYSGKTYEDGTPLDTYTFDDLTCDEKYQKVADREELAKMGVTIDCLVGEVDPKELKKRFDESDFLRKNFTCLSKIRRHYEKIMAGYYKTLRPSPQKPPEDDYMKHNYSAERLQAAVLHADDLDRFLEEREKYKNSRSAP